MRTNTTANLVVLRRGRTRVDPMCRRHGVKFGTLGHIHGQCVHTKRSRIYRHKDIKDLVMDRTMEWNLEAAVVREAHWGCLKEISGTWPGDKNVGYLRRMSLSIMRMETTSPKDVVPRCARQIHSLAASLPAAAGSHRWKSPAHSSGNKRGHAQEDSRSSSMLGHRWPRYLANDLANGSA